MTKRVLSISFLEEIFKKCLKCSNCYKKRRYIDLKYSPLTDKAFDLVLIYSIDLLFSNDSNKVLASLLDIPLSNYFVHIVSQTSNIVNIRSIFYFKSIPFNSI